MDGCDRLNFAQDLPRAERIARLNDTLRISGEGGQISVTAGISALAGYSQKDLLAVLAAYADFDTHNDPHGERDFGGFDYLEAELLWKVDYYDNTLTYLSDDPADADTTIRILTIMLATEH